MTILPTEDQFVATIRVAQTPFSEPTYICAYAVEQREALDRCRAAAAERGWRPPAWWQWSRRSDSGDAYVGPLL